jgi:hypothetical protein
MAESKELTKEQQVRALREARYKKRLNPRLQATIFVPEAPPVTTPVTRHAFVTPCPRCKLTEAQLVHLEAEIKWLKQQLAKAQGEPAMSQAERARHYRERKRKKARDG